MAGIDEVRERVPIEQVVGRVVALKRAGSTLKGLCPFHGEKTPSFIVWPSRGTYKCFGCGEGGDIFSFVMKTRHLEFGDALRELAAEAGVTLDDPRQGRDEDSLKSHIYEMNAAAATYFQSMLAVNAGARARAYLERRAISAATIERFGLGYAPESRDGLGVRLRGAGYSEEEIVAAGLAIASEEGGPVRDRFRGRLIFPIRDAKGRILGFGGRVLDGGEPKYLNSPATAVFEKSRVLYTIEHAAEAMRSTREGVVVEGYMDALRAHQEGFGNVVATLGTAITEQQLHGLARLAPRLVLALDADPAGQKAAVRAGLAALHALPRRSDPADLSGAARREAVQVYVAALPDGQDPDDAIAADAEIWRRAIADAAPLMDHYVALVEKGLDRAQPSWRQEAIDTLAPAIAQLDGVGLQQVYIERLAALTGVDARYLRDLIPGGAPRTGSGKRPAPRRESAAPAAAPRVDAIRVTEEYLLGLLLLHRPLAPDARAELEGYIPMTGELAPLLAALLAGSNTVSLSDDLIERLSTAAQRQPAVPPHQLAGAVRLCLARIHEERARRELLDLGRVLAEVDRDTAYEMETRTLETMIAKEQLVVRYQKEQSQYRRQPSTG